MTAPASPRGDDGEPLSVEAFTALVRELRRDEMWLGMKDARGSADASSRSEETTARIIAAYTALASRLSLAEGDSKTAKVTRVEVIDHRNPPTLEEVRGRVFTAKDCTAAFSIQDDGRTLKLFVADASRPSPERPSEETDHGTR